jgi:hypothetical protein
MTKDCVIQARSECHIPPAGWRCTREIDHEGPCAAVPDTIPQPVGWAYRYADGIRFNDGREVNGGRAIEAIPYYFGKPQLIIRAS